MDRFVLLAVSTLTKPPIHMWSCRYVLMLQQRVLCSMAPPPPKKSPIPLLLKFWFVPTIPHLKAASDTYKQKKLWMHWDLLQRWKGRKKAFLNKVLGKYSRSSSRSICNYMTYVSMWAFQAHSRQCDYKQWDFVFFKCIFCIERFLLAEEIGKLNSSRKMSFVSSLVARHDTTWEFYI